LTKDFLCDILKSQKIKRRKEAVPLEKKLRHSQQRDRIYDYLQSCCGHPDAETIYQALRPEMPALSLGTVYRNLKLLEELGKVRRLSGLPGGERYDCCCGDHIHFICRSCGQIRDLEGVDLCTIRSAIPLDKGCCVQQMDLSISGLCPDCAGR